MRTKNVQAEIDLSDVWAVDARFVKRAEQYLAPGDTLVSSANSWNLVGKCCWVPKLDGAATFGGFISALRPSSDLVNGRYLYRWFSSEKVQATVRSFGRQTTNISNLDFARCLKLDIPLPSLAEQRRIVEVLDDADAQRVNRRKAIALLDDLAESVFLDMFGDPVVNEHGWPRVKLHEVMTHIDSGWSPVCLDRPVEGQEWGVLKLGAVTSCEFKPSENKALPLALSTGHSMRSRQATCSSPGRIQGS